MATRKTILVLDDEPSILASVTLIFQEQYQVLTAETSQAAFDHLKKTKVDLILLDLKLYGEEGLDFLKQLRVLYPATKVLVLSGKFTQQEEKELVESLGIEGFIVKPFDLFELTSRVDRLLA